MQNGFEVGSILFEGDICMFIESVLKDYVF